MKVWRTRRQWKIDNGDMKWKKQKQWTQRAKSPTFQYPTGAFTGQPGAKRRISVHYIARSDDWRQDETELCLVNYTYIHTDTQVTPRLSLMSTYSSGCCESPSSFCWPVYGRVDRGERAISRTSKHGELDHPWRDLFGATPCLSAPRAVSVTVQGSDPSLVSGSEAPLPGLRGNTTTYTRPCQTCDWHVAAHFQQHSHPPRQITPKPRQMTVSRRLYLFSCHPPYVAVHKRSSDLDLLCEKLCIKEERADRKSGSVQTEERVTCRQRRSKYTWCSLATFTWSILLCLVLFVQQVSLITLRSP